MHQCRQRTMAHRHNVRHPLAHTVPARRTCPPPSSSPQDVSRQGQRQASEAAGFNGIVVGRSRSQHEDSCGDSRFSAFLGDKHCSKTGNHGSAWKHTSKHGGRTHVTLNVPRIVSTVSEKRFSSEPSTPEPMKPMNHTFTDPLPQGPTNLLYESSSVPLAKKRLVPMLNLRHSSLSPCAPERTTASSAGSASRPPRDLHLTNVQSTCTSEAGSAQSVPLVQDNDQVDVLSMRASNAGGDQSLAMGQGRRKGYAQDMQTSDGKDAPKCELASPRCSSRVAWSDLVDQCEPMELHFESLMQQVLEDKLPNSKDALQCDVGQQSCAASSSFSVPLSPGLHRRRAVRFPAESAADMRARLCRRVTSRHSRVRLTQSQG